MKTLCFHMMKNKDQAVEPASGLKLLLSLDNEFYDLQGQLAIEYGHGNHTEHRYMRYHEFFCTRISDDNRVLDLACGTGVVSQAVVTATAAQVIGIDASR
jgi:ribosomal protein L11 methylase PrmA